MFVQLNKDEVIAESAKKVWYLTNKIVWMIIFIFPILNFENFKKEFRQMAHTKRNCAC